MSQASATQLISMIGSSIGEELAREAVSRERSRLGVGETMTQEEAARVLVAIEQAGGPAGLAARLARIRLERNSTSSTSTSGAISVRLPGFTTTQVVDMFTSALGVEKATEVIKTAKTQQGVLGDHITYEQVTRMLEMLSRQQGVVSTVARFAKARLALKSG